MNVLVTGGTGSVGRAVVQRLAARGWEVLVVGRRPDMRIDHADYAVCDVTDFESLRAHARGRDAIVHLAAIAQPTGGPGPEVFRVNALGTFCVFEAAAREQVRRVVQASSINAFGCAWGLGDVRVEYFPIDEEHPTYTTDPYSYSKAVVEDIGRYYWRREGIKSVALRLPWVYASDYVRRTEYTGRVQRARATIDELLAMPDRARRQRLAELHRRELAFRRRRPMEYGAPPRRPRTRGSQNEPLRWTYSVGRFNFWAFLDERDSAQAVEKSLTAEIDGSHELFINDSHNWLLYDSERLLRLFFPAVVRRKKPICGSQSLVSIDRARELIGFEPDYSIASLSPPDGGEA